MSNETRFRMNLLGLLMVVLVWLGSVIGCTVYAFIPGNGGALLLSVFFAFVGYGFFREGVEQVGRSLDRYPVRDY